MWVEMTMLEPAGFGDPRHPLREDVSWNNSFRTFSTSNAVILFVRMWVEIFNIINISRGWMSSSSWGCELKYSVYVLTGDDQLVILFVRMWVEMRLSPAISDNRHSHPLREDVSWNKYMVGATLICIAVILFVRMWVEILNNVSSVMSRVGHPLREDVSWNFPVNYSVMIANVILFVRMWVEICVTVCTCCYFFVILFVRMWVEILEIVRDRLKALSSSSWGCELKWY